MSYDERRKSFTRFPIEIVEIKSSYCAHTFGVGECTATGSGDSKCYNTEASCQDKENILLENKSYYFCEDVSPLPSLEASHGTLIPSLSSVSVSPAKIDLEGGLGVRSQATVSLLDHPSSDIGVDKYVHERSYDPMETGTFWTKWRARNKFYQNHELIFYSGYLDENGEGMLESQARHYVIDSVTVSRGSARITAKDPLNLARNDRSKVPEITDCELMLDIDEVETSLTVSDSSYFSVGDFVRVRSEVMLVVDVTGNIIEVERGRYNTAPDSHSEGDTVQYCLNISGKSVNEIVEMLLTSSGVKPEFIPSDRWEAEVSQYMPGLFSTLITEPTGVQKLLKELGESAPHYLYWDERSQKIELKVVKEPPSNAPVLNEDGHILEGSFSTSDDQNMRYSTVIVYFGQYDPTQKLDEVRNYQQAYARVYSDSIINYGNNKIKTIYSRWISNLNKASAVRLATRWGRRFGDVPRVCNFSLDAKDSQTWTSDIVLIEHRDIAGFSGDPLPTMFEVTSVSPKGQSYDYSALEYTYGPSLPQDDFQDELTVIIPDSTNVNIRDVFDNLYPSTPENSVVRIIIESSVDVGSNSSSDFSLDTGVWPETTTLVIENRGRIVGKGGDGATVSDGNGEDGGPAIILNHPITLENTGVIGGGGGGGGFAFEASHNGNEGYVAGGGGAGYIEGAIGETPGPFEIGGGGIRYVGDLDQLIDMVYPKANGEGGGVITFIGAMMEPLSVESGSGGGLGEDGSPGNITNHAGAMQWGSSDGGFAGAAIVTNGHEITYTEEGDIRGEVL